jgi:hypothetical protein
MNNVLVIYDDLVIDNQLVRERLEDLTNFYYNQPDWRVITTKNIDSTLEKICLSGATDYVVVNALGHFFRHGSHSEMVKLARDTGAPLVGHLLDRHGYYSFDPQYFCLDMRAYQQLGRPSLLPTTAPETFASITVERSQENFHDDYTPFWLRAGVGTQEYSVPFREFGSVLVQALIESGRTLQNIPQDMRDRKHYLYPNAYTAELESFFTDCKYQTDAIPLRGYFDAIRRYFQDEGRNIYILSTEPVPTKTMQPGGFHGANFTEVTVGPLDTYVGVCGALKTIPILFTNGFNTETRINLIDISTAALDYQRYLRDNWDGDLDTYRAVFDAFRDRYPRDYIYCWKSWNGWDAELASFINGCGMTHAEFKSAWQTYLQCPVKYHVVNLLDHVQVADMIRSVDYQGTSYTWVSNAFNMEHTTAAYGAEFMSRCYLQLLRQLKAQPGRVFIEQNNTVELLAGPRQR